MSRNRTDKVNSLLEQEISQIMVRDFAALGEPRPSKDGRDFHGTIITLTNVETTPNLIEAKGYISVLPEEKTDQVIKILNGQVYDIQQQINKKLNMRPIPRIRFVKDTQIASAAKIEGILATLKKEEK